MWIAYTRLIAECVSLRLWNSRDVCMYIRLYVRSCLCQCQFALTLRNSGITDTCITRGHRWRTELGGGHVVSWRWRTKSTAWLGFCNVCIWRSRVQKECWMQPTAGDSEKKKAKKSVHHRRQGARREQERVQKKKAHITVDLYCSLGSH